VAEVPSGPERPAVGGCRADGSVIDADDDPQPLVPCESAHAFETVAVSEVPEPWRSAAVRPGFDDVGLRSWAMDQGCPSSVLAGAAGAGAPAEGSDGVEVRPALLVHRAWFLPTTEEWAGGARWLRCDAAVVPGGEALETSLAAAGPDRLRPCLRGDDLVSCDRAHDREVVVELVFPDGPYPGSDAAPSAVESLGRRCLEEGRALVGDDADDPRQWRVVFPDADDWASGARVVRCDVHALGIGSVVAGG
jgi:hypothetical protein